MLEFLKITRNFFVYLPFPEYLAIRRDLVYSYSVSFRICFIFLGAFIVVMLPWP